MYGLSIQMSLHESVNNHIPLYPIVVVFPAEYPKHFCTLGTCCVATARYFLYYMCMHNPVISVFLPQLFFRQSMELLSTKTLLTVMR